MKWIELIGYGLALGGAVWMRGGVDEEEWRIVEVGVLVLALMGEVWWLRRAEWERRWAERSGGRDWMKVWVLALVGVVGVQLAPLPGWVLRWLAPVSAEVWAGVGRVEWGQVTVAPPMTWGELTRLGATLGMVMGARRLARMWGERRWVAVVPVVVVAWTQAMLGLVQFWVARSGGGVVGASVGTYVNRNHFAGLLEMAAPVGAALAVGAYRRGATRRAASGGAGLAAGWWMVVTGCLVLGVVVSLSRMGFLAMLAGFGVGAAAGMGRGWKTAAAVVVLAAGFVFLPTDELIGRFASMAQTEDISEDTRAEIWRDTRAMIEGQPVLGSGLGTYVVSFLRYKKAAPANTVDYAHNDYLQVAAEMGLVGLGAALGLAGWVMKRAWSGARGREWLNMGLTGAVAAMALHSVVDFNLYIPANALALAWLAGVAVERDTEE